MRTFRLLCVGYLLGFLLAACGPVFGFTMDWTATGHVQAENEAPDAGVAD